jgi:hypothetical protein
MRINARIRALAVLVTVALTATACDGWSTRPTDMTSTGATLHAQTRCLADTTTNPCTYWFQYWADGSPTLVSTPHVVANVNTNGYIDVTQSVTGLSPNTLYDAQFCGFGDSNVSPPGICVGLPGGGLSTPGNRPDAGDFNAVQRFRTAGPGTLAVAELGRPLSTADTSTNPISRDAGQSAAYSSTQSLWLFGDTVQRNGPAFLPGTTAAAGPYTRGQVPTALQELPTPPAAPSPGRTSPAPFLPFPQGLQTPDNPPVPCGQNQSYAASWPSGLARVPGTSRVLIVYAQICVAINRTWPTGRLTLTEYDPATNSFTSTATPFVANPLSAGLPFTRILSSPVFGGDGFLYLFTADRDARKVLVARVAANASAWGSAANYRWWGQPAGGAPQWTTNESAAISIISGVVPWGVQVADYTGQGSHKLAMIVQTEFGTGDFRVFEASSPTGPWTAGSAGRVPDTCVGGFGCYAFVGHAELTTPDTFVLSWYSPGDRSGFGHIRLGTIAW